MVGTEDLIRQDIPSVPYSIPKRRSKAAGVIIPAIAICYVGVLVLGPLLAMVRGALGQGAGEFLSQLTSADAAHALVLTILLSLGAVVVNTIFGLPAAWVLVRHRFFGRRLLNALVDLPFAVSPVVAGLMLRLLFGRTGWFAPLIQSTGIRIVFGLPGAVLATIFVSLPFVIREVMPVLQELGREQELAAYTLGSGAWRTFLRVTLPGIQWGLTYGVTLTFARAMGEFGAVLVASGGVIGESETATLFISRALDERNEVGAYAMAVVLATISIALLALMETLKRHRQEK